MHAAYSVILESEAVPRFLQKNSQLGLYFLLCTYHKLSSAHLNLFWLKIPSYWVYDEECLRNVNHGPIPVASSLNGWILWLQSAGMPHWLAWYELAKILLGSLYIYCSPANVLHFEGKLEHDTMDSVLEIYGFWTTLELHPPHWLLTGSLIAKISPTRTSGTGDGLIEFTAVELAHIYRLDTDSSRLLLTDWRCWAPIITVFNSNRGIVSLHESFTAYESK